MKNLSNIKKIIQLLNIIIIFFFIKIPIGIAEEIPKIDIDPSIKLEELLNTYSENLIFTQNNVKIIKQKNQDITKEEILKSISISELSQNFEIFNLEIVDEEHKLLDDQEVITNLYQMMITTNETISYYPIYFWGDFNQDSILNQTDLEIGINQFLTNTKEENLSSNLSEEISYLNSFFTENTDQVLNPSEIELNNTLELIGDDELKVGDTIKIIYKINGLEETIFNTISGNIQYNQELLKLNNITTSLTPNSFGNFLNNQFIYLFDLKQNKDTFLIFEFKILKSGTSNISLDDLKILTNGKSFKIKNNHLEIIIPEENKNSSINTNSNPLITNSIPEKKSNVITLPQKDITKSNQVITTIVLNHDNYIKSLKITGYEIKFQSEIQTYTITVASNVSSLKLDIILNDDNASCLITGNENFKEGKNEVILTIIAEDGSSRDYIIEVNKKPKKFVTNTNHEEFNSKKIILLLILMILGITIISIIFQNLFHRKIKI